MNYVDPAVVTSPKTKVSNVEVIRDGGEWGWSVVKLHWENEPALGIRWNGSYDGQPKGLPQSHGFPTWFVLPAELHDNVLEYCAKNNPNMVMINPPSLESIYDQANQIRKILKVNPLPDLRAIFDDASAEWTNSPYDKKLSELKRIADSGRGELSSVYEMYSMMYVERQDILERFPYAILELMECLLRKQ